MSEFHDDRGTTTGTTGKRSSLLHTLAQTFPDRVSRPPPRACLLSFCSAHLVFLDDLREPIEAIPVDGTRDGVVAAVAVVRFRFAVVGVDVDVTFLRGVGVEPQGLEFPAGKPPGRMRCDGDPHPVPVKVDGQDRVRRLLPFQDRGDPGGLAQPFHPVLGRRMFHDDPQQQQKRRNRTEQQLLGENFDNL